MDWTHADAWMPTWPILRTKHHCRTGLYDVETGLTHRYIHVKQTSCAGHRQMCLPTAQILCSAKQQVLFGCTVMNNGVQAPNSDALKRTIGLFNLVCPLGTSSRKFSTSDATVWNWPGTSSPDFAPPFFFGVQLGFQLVLRSLHHQKSKRKVQVLGTPYENWGDWCTAWISSTSAGKLKKTQWKAMTSADCFHG